MEEKIKLLENQVLQLKEAIRWLTGELALTSNWIGKSSGKLKGRELEENKEYFNNRLRSIIGEI